MLSSQQSLCADAYRPKFFNPLCELSVRGVVPTETVCCCHTIMIVKLRSVLSQHDQWVGLRHVCVNSHVEWKKEKGVKIHQ